MHPHAARCCLLGTAVGDSVGLPMEGLSPQRAARLFPNPDRHNFLFGHGMLSDDTEHACMTAQSLIESHFDEQRFGRAIGARLRAWTLALPAATGFATLRAGIKLCVGVSSARSGVYSAGNGPMMRAAIIGAACADPSRIAPLIRISTCTTHTDPKAEQAALLIAIAAHRRATGQPINPSVIPDAWSSFTTESLMPEIATLLNRCEHAARAQMSARAFAVELGLSRGVSGYALHTLPIALLAAARSGDDLRAGVLDAIACGGDTDSTAAIVGGIIGAGGIEPPADWLRGIIDWPRTPRWIAALGDSLTGAQAGESVSPPSVFYPAAIARNLAFAGIVLAHAARRFLPPY